MTTHDALGYYAGRYGIEVVGAVLPSLSTQAQPSAPDVQALVDQIRRTGVQAIYPESSINAKLERAVARESGAEVGRSLWADTLGPEGSSGATYVESIAANTRAIVDGLTGGGGARAASGLEGAAQRGPGGVVAAHAVHAAAGRRRGRADVEAARRRRRTGRAARPGARTAGAGPARRR